MLEETGKRIRETYGTNLLEKAKMPKELKPGNKNSALLLKGDKKEILITLPAPVTINRVALQEDIMKHGERVEKHAVDA